RVASGERRLASGFDLALADCTLAAMVNVVQGALVTGQRPRRYGNAHPQIVPYEAFATADGYLVVAVGNDSQWQRFCEAVGRTDWARDPRFATNPNRVERRELLIPQINQLMMERTTSEWLSLLTKAEVPHAPVIALDEILATPQVAARGMVQDLTATDGRTYQVIASPIHVEGEPFCSPLAPPKIGEHSGEILRDWLRYSPEQIQALRTSGAIT
ncbi:MAG TPA: CaiB/BaiF CoA-transferase family protein, partial [Pirellulales bacterium]|nr:CaiB/BaiF CoA-transferase family protein [Pirellulales bacterium]